MIPKLIHQTAKTRDIPEKWREYQKRVQELHPDWTYRLWTDEDNLAFVKAEYPDFLDVFLKLPKNIMRADVIRYLILNKLGGLYMDLDYEMLKPFDLNEHDCVLAWESDGEFGPGNDKLCNSFMASSPGHPFFKRVIEELKAHPPLEADVHSVEASTGPIFISRIYREAASKEGMKIHTPRRALFSPTTPRNQREYQAILDEGVAYGIHHCHGSWREFTLRQRIRQRVVGSLRQVMGAVKRR
jgi:mannosyltransferase OCH1-like enzyme